MDEKEERLKIVSFQVTNEGSVHATIQQAGKADVHIGNHSMVGQLLLLELLKELWRRR